jgi:hypothetical protein
MSYSQAFINAVRELLGKNQSRSERVSTKAAIEFAENPQLPRTTPSSSGAETQLVGSNMELTSLGARLSNGVGENVNGEGERGPGVGQDLEEWNLEFPIIERQL